MIAEWNSFYLDMEEPNKSCLLTLRSIILEVDEGMAETRKYGMPCFTYRRKVSFYLWIDKKTKEPYILFVAGKHIDHPALESGNRAKMKILRVDPSKDMDVDLIKELLNKGLDLYRTGMKTNF